MAGRVLYVTARAQGGQDEDDVGVSSSLIAVYDRASAGLSCIVNATTTTTTTPTTNDAVDTRRLRACKAAT